VRLTIEPRGPFSLRAAAQFGFGPTEGNAPAFDGVMRLAFPIDGGAGYAGVAMRQPLEHGPLEVESLGDGDGRLVARQLARVLSLDHDGEAFLEVGERDPVIGELQRRYPGERPVLFHSPYEAAAWSVISARRRSAQAAAVRRSIGTELGATFVLDGQEVVAFPQPQRLLEAAELPGLSGEKAERLRTVAGAALDGALDVERLHELGPEASWTAMQALPGIGPFYAGLIVLRAAGLPTPRCRWPSRASWRTWPASTTWRSRRRSSSTPRSPSGGGRFARGRPCSCGSPATGIPAGAPERAGGSGLEQPTRATTTRAPGRPRGGPYSGATGARASPAASSRSRSALCSCGVGSHWATSGSSSALASPKTFRNSVVVR